MTKPTLAEAMKRMERLLDGVTFTPEDMAAWAVVKEAAEHRLPPAKSVDHIYLSDDNSAPAGGREG